MNPADNLERAIEKLHVTTKADTDKRILNDAFVALRAAAVIQPSGLGARLWQAAVTSRITWPAAAAAVILTGFAVFFGTLGTKPVTVRQIYAALGEAENVCISTFQAGQTEPHQQVWTSQTLQVKVLRTGGRNQAQFALWDIPNRVRMIKYLSLSPVPTETITDEMLAELEKSMTAPAGLVPFSDAAEVPEDAQWTRVDDPEVKTVVPGARVYDLTWRQEGPTPGAAAYRKWRVFVDARTDLPKRAEWYTKLEPQQGYVLEVFISVSYPSESEVRELVRNTFGPPESRQGGPQYMPTPGAER